MTTLVVPGVRVEARFDVLPPLPAPSGILGAVGVVDRPPSPNRLVGISKISELRQILGPGTEASMPEVTHALANGVSEVLISPVRGGGAASVTLDGSAGNPAVRLRCRSNGASGNALRAEVREVANADGDIVRVTINLYMNGRLVESFVDLRVAPGQPDDLFDSINLRSRHVVALDPGFVDVLPEAGTYPFDADGTPINVEETGAGTRALFQLMPNSEIDPNGLSVELATANGRVTVRVFRGGLLEEFTDLVMNPEEPNHLPLVLATQSRFIRTRPLSSIADEAQRLPAGTTALAEFTGGSSPTVNQYRDAISLLEEDTRIDMVLASTELTRDQGEVREIHQTLATHAVRMADAGAPRIVFGSITSSEANDLTQIRDHAASARNRRFVLVAPPGAAGAVAGLVGRLNPQESPTFKPVPLHGIPPSTYRESQLNRLLGPTTNLLVVQQRTGRGVIVLRGLDTTGDQISVTRVADTAIRETKAISENFIGQLNTQDARTALRQQIVATFTRMERAGALVPSADGADPAFVVDVYSTPLDFAQGIVRIDIAVRPVRAIDYIYATIRVKNV